MSIFQKETDHEGALGNRGGLFGTGFLASKANRYTNYLEDMQAGKANYKPGKYNKAMQYSDMVKAQKGELGMSEAEQQQAREADTRTAGNVLEAQNAQFAQAALTGNSGELNQAIRGSQNALAEAGAVAGAETNQLAKATELSKTADLQARVERQQERNRANAQFWISMFTGNAGAIGDMMASLSEIRENGGDNETGTPEPGSDVDPTAVDAAAAPAAPATPA